MEGLVCGGGGGGGCGCHWGWIGVANAGLRDGGGMLRSFVCGRMNFS